MSQSGILRACLLVLTLLILSGCGGAAPTYMPATEAAMTEAQDQPTASAPQPARSLTPQPITFKSSDGTDIAALYWPPVTSPAPGVVLMHMMGGSKTDWGQFATLLQGAAIAQDGSQFQATPSFAVLAIDFRGHGESGGTRDDLQGMLNDARAAFVAIRAMPDVDNSRIVMIGASIGADAAVDACGDGCIGAVSLSPGSFLGVPYNDALKAMGDRPVLCVAATADQDSAVTCNGGETVGLSDFQVQIYNGPEHGTNMFNIQDQKPHLTDLLFAWLRGHFS